MPRAVGARRRLGVLATSLLAIAVAIPARAAADPAIAIVTSPGPLGDGARAAAEEVARRFGREPADGGAAGVDAKRALACVRSDAGCAKAVKGCAAERVLVLDAAVDGSNTVITGWLIDGATGAQVAADRRFCDRCRQAADVKVSASELVEALLARDRQRAAPDTRIEVATRPEGAIIRLDGRAVGVSGRPYPVSPGNVEVEVEKPGYRTVRRAVEVPPHETYRLAIDLEIAPDGRRDWARIGGWTVGAAGVGVTALGVVWIAIDGPRFDGGDRLPERRETLVPGLVATGVGAGLIATSVYLLFVRGTPGPSEERAFAVELTGDGAVVTAGGRF